MPAAYADVPRRPPVTRRTALNYPEHAMDTRHPQLVQGDPLNIRNVVNPSDFYSEGKPWVHPGHHVNLFTSVRAINSLMEPVFGFISKLRYVRQPNRLVRGRQHTLGQAVNIDPAPTATAGDFATYVSGQQIRNGRG